MTTAYELLQLSNFIPNGLRVRLGRKKGWIPSQSNTISSDVCICKSLY